MPRISKALEDGVEILSDHQQRAGAERCKQMPGDKLQRGVLRHVVGAAELFVAVFSRVAFFQSRVNLEEKLEQGRAGLVLIQPRDPKAVCELVVLAHAADDERDEVGFSTAPGTDKEKVVLVIGERALLYPFHCVLEQFLPLDQNGLKDPGIGAARRENPDGLAVCRPLARG